MTNANYGNVPYGIWSGGNVRGITIGKPTKHLCPHCHADRIARHVKRWEDLVRAARDRL